MSRKLFHILLLRHGLTDANATGTLQGWSPTELNRVGQRQAVELARHVARWTPRIQYLISSDLTRAMQTADEIAKHLHLRVHPDQAWRERGLGILEGKTLGAREIWRTATGEVAPPGAETLAGFSDRVINALIGLPSQHPRHSHVAVVTHGGCIRMILRALTDGRLPMSCGPIPELQVIDNCSVTHLTVNRDGDIQRWNVECLNDATHLTNHESGDVG